MVWPDPRVLVHTDVRHGLFDFQEGEKNQCEAPMLQSWGDTPSSRMVIRATVKLNNT